MQNVGIVFLFLAFGAIAFFFQRARRERVERWVREWAAENDLEVADVERKWFCKGPYFFRSTKEQIVLRVRFLTRQGVSREAWVRCGGFFLGTLSRKVDVTWID